MGFFQRIVGVAIGLSCAWRIDAQATTSVVCTQDLWTANQEGNSPCLVASALQSACNAGKWNISPLSPTSVYSGPLQGQSNKCQCSTVVFSLVSACGACQSGSVESWVEWKTNCSLSDISIASFPLTIPQGITVPAWAYLNVSIKGIWDPTDALNSHNSNAPDSSAIAATATPTATLTAPTTTDATSASTTSGVLASSTTSSKSSTNAGAIAGGVVGGVVGLALIALAAFIFLRHRRRAAVEPASAQFTGNGTRGEKLGLTGPSPSSAGFPSPHLPMQTEPPKLYDPSDPSTFPASPSSSLPGYATSASPVPSASYTQTSAPYTQTSAPFSNVSGSLSPTTAYSPTSAYGHTHQTSQGYTGRPEV